MPFTFSLFSFKTPLQFPSLSSCNHCKPVSRFGYKACQTINFFSYYHCPSNTAFHSIYPLNLKSLYKVLCKINKLLNATPALSIIMQQKPTGLHLDYEDRILQTLKCWLRA